MERFFATTPHPTRTWNYHQVSVEFMFNAHKDLRSILTDHSRQSIHKALPHLDFGEERANFIRRGKYEEV